MYEPASLGMFQCRLQRILCDFEVIMFFRKDPPQTEGRRNADPLIKTSPEGSLPLKISGGVRSKIGFYSTYLLDSRVTFSLT